MLDPESTSGGAVSFNIVCPTTPNLTCYTPAGWSNSIVVSNSTGTNTDGTLTGGGTFYIDWAIQNNGTGATAATFYTNLYLDGVLQNQWSTVGLANGSYTYVLDYPLVIPAGSHTLSTTTDVTSVVTESNESDNSCTRTDTYATPPPANDACANAVNISSLPFSTTGTNSGAITDDPNNSTICGAHYNNIWWKVTGICGTMTASTCGSTWDNEVHIYTGTCGSLTEFTCNDDYGPSCPASTQGSVSWAATAGTIYYISVGSYSDGTSGDIQLNVTAVADAPPSISSATAGSPSVCPGGTTNLTANGVGGAGATVTWWTGAGGTGTSLGTGTTYSGAGPGTYYARVTGNCSPAQEASITVGTLSVPAITSITAGSNPICFSTTTSLTANLPGGGGDGAVVTWWTGSGGTGSNLGNGTSLPNVAPGTYYARVTGTCSPAAEASITVGATYPVVPTSPATYTSASVNHVDGATNNYAVACSALAAITDAAGGNVLGNTTISSVLSASVASPNADGYIYGRRKYTVNASSTGAATLKLYFTQADFDNYNSNNSQFLDLPTSGNNADPNKLYFRIARVTGGTYTISGPLGDFLTWNSTDSRWEVDYAVTDINADYYFVSMASCDGIVVSGLQATNVQGSSIVATWNNLVTTPAWGWYSLQYKPTSSGTWTDAGTSNGGTTSKLIVGLQPATNYEIQIRRHCSSQSTGPWSSSVLFSTTNPACSSPPVLTMTSINSNSATMTWPAVTGAGWFEFRYSTVAPGGPWTSGGTSGGTATSKVFTGLLSNTTYYVQARTFCASNGQPSEWGSTSFATPGPSGCALPPVMTASTINATNVTVTWPAVGGAGWFEFRYKLTSSGTWITAGTLTGSAVTKLFGGLMAGTSYDIGARSFCSNGQPSEWGSITVTTAVLAGCEMPPALNTNPINATNVTVNWSFISGAAWYEFRYKLTSSGTWISGGTLGGNAISKIFSGLTPNTGYDFGARTFCSNGQPSAWSSISITTGLLAGCELPPTLSVSTVSPTTATLTWPVIGSAGWYEFRYSTNPTGPWTSGGTSGGLSTSKVLSNLSVGTTYYAQARSFCTSNGLPSAWSSNVTFMTIGAALVSTTEDEMIGEIADTGNENGEESLVTTMVDGDNVFSKGINSISATQLHNMTIYPNPTRENVTVEFFTEEVAEMTMFVMDMTGRILRQVEVVAFSGINTLNIKLDELPNGMYMIQLRDSGQLTHVGKVQKLD